MIHNLVIGIYLYKIGGHKTVEDTIPPHGLKKPNDYDNIHTDYNKPIVSIVEPNIENIYPVNQKIELLIESRGVYSLSKIDIFINDVFVGTSNNPINFSFTPGELDNLKTLMKLK